MSLIILTSKMIKLSTFINSVKHENGTLSCVGNGTFELEHGNNMNSISIK